MPYLLLSAIFLCFLIRLWQFIIQCLPKESEKLQQQLVNISTVGFFPTIYMMKIINLRKVTISIALTSASSVLLASSAWAQPPTNPDYGRSLQDKTVCSFITANNVNARSVPSS